MQYNIKNAVTGDYPDYGINYSKVLVSRGDLDVAIEAAATGGAGQVTFTWKDTSDEDSSGRPDDKAILVIYCEAQNKCIFRLRTATRKDGSATVNVPRFKRRSSAYLDRLYFKERSRRQSLCRCSNRFVSRCSLILTGMLLLI